jgi:hypothetical protein
MGLWFKGWLSDEEIKKMNWGNTKLREAIKSHRTSAADGQKRYVVLGPVDATTDFAEQPVVDDILS